MFSNINLALVNSYNRNIIVDIVASHNITVLDAIDFMVDMQYLSL